MTKDEIDILDRGIGRIQDLLKYHLKNEDELEEMLPLLLKILRENVIIDD